MNEIEKYFLRACVTYKWLDELIQKEYTADNDTNNRLKQLSLELWAELKSLQTRLGIEGDI